jgi:isocitrate/isopropylmalate dehydrogenase
VAYRTEQITRASCRAVAEYSFVAAATLGGRVLGGPKWTVSPVYQGLLKEELDEAAARHPFVPYSPTLIDATYAALVGGGIDGVLVVPALNRDGDCLADLVLALFGSIAGAESVVLSLDAALKPRVAMAEAPHGTAPALLGKDLANPMAMLLACAAVLDHAASQGGAHRAAEAGVAIREAVISVAAEGIRTVDLGGNATTSEVTDEVVARVRARCRA